MSGPADSDETFDSFLAEIARLSAPTRRPTATHAAGEVVASRYVLTRLLGRGAHGVVWAARDRLACADVAVKLIVPLSREHAAQLRAEVTALRRLRIPRVVALIDEGLDGESVFLSMPIVRGAPFPGPGTRDWSTLAKVVDRLLETLAAVHAYGIVHRDLKPQNVLVHAGQPTLLDFGLSAGLVLEGVPRSGGTPAYLAPEQVSGVGVDARADLYAVGAMVFEALTGRLPHLGPDVAALLAEKEHPPPPIATLVDLPARVASTLDALLAPDAAARPSTASLARAALLGVSERPPAVRHGRETLAELCARFAGPDRLDWVARDAARILLDRTGGECARVDLELEAWRSQGRCHLDGEGLLRMTREAVDQLEPTLWTVEGPDLAREALALARRLAEDGRLGLATAALQEALSTLRRAPVVDGEALVETLSTWVPVALADGDTLALDRVLYELHRSGGFGMEIPHLEALVRAALSMHAWSERTSALADAVPPFVEPALEQARLEVRVRAARRASREREEQVVQEVLARAEALGHPDLAAATASWLGKLRYRQGRYAEAADLQLRAARAARFRTDRVAATIHAASATLECFEPAAARALAREARDEAAACRNPHLAARAEWLLRAADYRLREYRVDEELLVAARALGAPEIFGIVCLVEATHAYRLDRTRARSLSTEAHAWWAGAGEPVASLLSGALAVACGEALPAETTARLAEAATSCAVPGVGLQALALLGAASPRPAEAVVARLAATVPRERWSEPMDVLSVDEALALL